MLLLKNVAVYVVQGKQGMPGPSGQAGYKVRYWKSNRVSWIWFILMIWLRIVEVFWVSAGRCTDLQC